MPARIRPRSPNLDAPPLSYAQERLWIINQSEQDKGAYNLATAIRFDRLIGEAALADAIREIVRRHEVLRTTFPIRDARPVQEISPIEQFSTAIVDLTGLNEPTREEMARALAVEQAKRPFDLAQGPVLHTKLVRFGDAEHVLTVSFHHIAIDGFCSHIFLRELSTLYSSFLSGKPSPLPELGVQYADFAVWQRETLQGEKLEGLVSYWKNHLAGQNALEFSTDYPRSVERSYRGARRSRILSAELTRRIQETTRRLGVTQFMTFLAAFKAVLYRSTGQHDVSIGAPIANRTDVELEGLIGCFVNTLVFRTDVSGDPTFEELVRRVREVCQSAYAHQDIPFEKLVEEVKPPREPGKNPLFQYVLNYNNTPTPFVMNDPNAGKLRTGWINAGTSMFELILNVDPINPLTMATDEINCVMEYNTDLFDATTIDRLLRNLEVFLEAAVNDPSRRISELPVLSPEQTHQLLREWNDSAATYLSNRCIHEWFEQQVEKTPEAIAVIDGRHRVTYLELNSRANHLGQRIVDLGVAPEMKVGICLRRSVELVIGMLAVLKAGGAYVPMDAAYPRERLSFILEDSGSDLLLTESALIDRLPETRPVTVFVDEQSHVPTAELSANLPIHVNSDNLAYLIYTSGSTGKPKGVAISHRSASALTEWSTHIYSKEEFAGMLAAASICFDLSVFEIFVTLAAGGKVILAENALQLPELEAKDEITLFTAMPSVMAELLRMQAIPDSVRTVNLGGEALAASLAQQAYESSCAEKVYNLYGPSEDTTLSTFALLERGARSQPPIGRPLSQTRPYVLDENQQPVPIGSVGELYIGGEKLARGYFGRPDLTGEKFVPNLWAKLPGSRLYRTGDLVRYKADGRLDYVGRMNHQVKVRGYRIELGEVEAALRDHEGVSDVVVIAAEATGGLTRMIGYVVEKRPGSAIAAELRQYLRTKLPEYMIPAAFVPLDQMPLNGNGKIDRRSLPAPEQLRPTSSSTFIPPRTELERTIAGVWHEVLGIPEIGLDENFFELGGNSLLMVQLRLKLQKVLNREVSMMDLFKNSTIASLAKSLWHADEPEELLQSSSTRGDVRRDAVKRRRESRQARLSTVN